MNQLEAWKPFCKLYDDTVELMRASTLGQPITNTPDAVEVCFSAIGSIDKMMADCG